MALRKIYSFQQLPETYFIKLPPLPDDPTNLNQELQNFFPITKWKNLNYLSFYHSKLRNFHNFKGQLPESYFNLPPLKPQLLSTYHELNHIIRSIFPIDTNDSNTDINKIVILLRRHYAFKMIPNDYFVTRPLLPLDTSKIITDTKFTYPITDDESAKEFYTQAIKRYKVIFPIPTYIMTANPTNKPLLPDRITIIINHSLTLPITSRDQLIETIKIL